MRFAPYHPFLVRLLLLLSLAAVLGASVCSAQDKPQTTNPNAGKDEDDIKQLISTYAKAADQADPTLASASGATHRETHLSPP
ncbi:MAG: hypothetical protein WBW53_12685 [Terriglobales bacterium]